MMLTSLVLLLATRIAVGQIQCPTVAASFGDDLDLSSFYISLNDHGSSGISASGSGFCKLFQS